jgi:hypothetical protein
VIPLLILALHIAPHSGMDDMGAHRFVRLMRKGKCGRDPTVRVDHVTWDGAVGDTVDGITC